VTEISEQTEYEIVEGEVPEGWSIVEPNCRMAPTPLPAARVAKAQIENNGGKAIIIKIGSTYQIRWLKEDK
jgi:hypothetical protein